MTRRRPARKCVHCHHRGGAGGDAGRGFVVVAFAVKALAEQMALEAGRASAEVLATSGTVNDRAGDMRRHIDGFLSAIRAA
jgi:hypothetical protein